tara:strand:- start:498 stop:1310 length:813 start_codon:yes stop_codon:yes gene_type:complete
MPVLFKAKTQEGYTIKILAELLQHNIKTACFVINEQGITLRMMDSQRFLLMDLNLQSDNFAIYKFRSEEMMIGINLNHLHKMLKSIKKKDSIEIFIKQDQPTDLGIKILPKENNRITTSFIKIQNIQNMDIELPTGYGKPVIVPSNEYQKMCKDMNNISGTINVVSKGFYIKFLCNAGSVYSRQVAFGEVEDEDEDDDLYEENMDEFNQNFDTEQLSRVIKLSGLSSTMQVFPKDGLPLLFKSNVGNLGKLAVYIKSKNQIEEESLQENI